MSNFGAYTLLPDRHGMRRHMQPLYYMLLCSNSHDLIICVPTSRIRPFHRQVNMVRMYNCQKVLSGYSKTSRRTFRRCPAHRIPQESKRKHRRALITLHGGDNTVANHAFVIRRTSFITSLMFSSLASMVSMLLIFDTGYAH